MASDIDLMFLERFWCLFEGFQVFLGSFPLYFNKANVTRGKISLQKVILNQKNKNFKKARL